MLICQLTDLHVRPVGKPANRVSETNMFTERAFRAVARLSPRPDIVMITGDLTECGLDAEYANLARLLRKWLPMPVFVIPAITIDALIPRGLGHLPVWPTIRTTCSMQSRTMPSGWLCWTRWCQEPGTGRSARSNWNFWIAPGCRAGQTNHRGDAPPTLCLRHCPHGSHQSAQRARVRRHHRQAHAGRPDRLRTSPPAYRGPRGACHRVDHALGCPPGGNVARSQ